MMLAGIQAEPDPTMAAGARQEWFQGEPHRHYIAACAAHDRRSLIRTGAVNEHALAISAAGLAWCKFLYMLT